MKKYRNTSFLIELMINVLVLSISCAVLVSVIVQAYLIVQDTSRKNSAGNEISSLLQVARVRGLDALPGAVEQDGTLELYYDSDWQLSGAEEHSYVLRFTVQSSDAGAGEVQSVTALALRQNGEEICEIETALYRPREGVGA